MFLFLIHGKISLSKEILDKGDSAEIKDVSEISLKAIENSRVLVIEVIGPFN